MGFHLTVNYSPKGDQATAIEELVRGGLRGRRRLRACPTKGKSLKY